MAACFAPTRRKPAPCPLSDILTHENADRLPAHRVPDAPAVARSFTTPASRCAVICRAGRDRPPGGASVDVAYEGTARRHHSIAQGVARRLCAQNRGPPVAEPRRRGDPERGWPESDIVIARC